MFKYNPNEAEDPWSDEANKHHSFIADLGEMLDPMSYLHKGIGLGGLDVHKYAKPATTWLNEQVSTVSKPINQFMTSITPGKAWLDEEIPIAKWWNDTVENKPIDAAAIAAATVFSGGAGAGAGAGGGAGASGLGAAGNAAATSAVTPAFAGGTAASTAGAGLGSAGSAYGSAMLGGGVGSGAGMASVAPSVAAMNAGGGIGGIGLSGAQALTSAVTPELVGLGTNTGWTLGKAMDGVKEGYDYYKQGKGVYDAFNPQQQPQQDDQPPSFGVGERTVPIDQPLVMQQSPRRSLVALQAPSMTGGLLDFGGKGSLVNARRNKLMARKGMLDL